MKIFRVGLYLKYMLRLSRTRQCKQCKLKNYNKSNQSGLDLEILYMFWGWIGGDRDILLALKVFGL